MASVDGARPTDKPSEFASKVKCDPCVHSGLVKEASAYCEQCDEHMCVECASMHKGFKISRNHSIISGNDFHFTVQAAVKKHSLLYCAEHMDNAIEWYCENDDVMFCDTCKRIQHRKCQVTSVSDKKAFGHAQPLADVMDSLVSLSRRITKLKSERQNSKKQLEDVAHSCEIVVQQLKSTIIEKVERLTNQLLSDINKVVTTETLIIQDHVITCDSLIPQVEDALTTADEAKTAVHDVTSVIADHKLTKAITTLEPTVYGLEKEIYNVQIKFKPSDKLAEMFCGTAQLGVLVTEQTQKVGIDPQESVSAGVPPVSVGTCTSWFDMEVLSSTEINVSYNHATGSAVMPDDRLVVADYLNKQIMLLDQDFNIQSILTFPSAPHDVAVYGDSAAVVTMPNTDRLQYIHVDTTLLRAGHTIHSGESCFGVAVDGDKIYVTQKDEVYGDHVKVLDKSGNMTRAIMMFDHNIDWSTRSSFDTPIVYLTVGTGGTIYISEAVNSHITCYSNTGDVVYDVRHEDMSVPTGMSVDEEGNLLVCCFMSNTIHILGKDGAHHKAFLSSADGLGHPLSVSYRRSDRTLIVTMSETPSRAYKLQ